MAAAALTPAQTELINSFTQDEIPIKLRCAICSRLAVNAFRLPCCDQAICETCHSALPTTCPVCEHTPIAAADCKPHKPLRTTIRVFLRTEEKKREALRVKEEEDVQPTVPVDMPALDNSNEKLVDIAPETVAEQQSASRDELAENTHQTTDVLAPTEVDGPVLEDQQDVPQQSVEETMPGEELVNGEELVDEQHKDTTELEIQGPGTGDGNGDEMDDMTPAATESATPAASMMFDPSMAGMPNMMGMMGPGADFNQMQMMMAMQNGMGMNAFPMGMAGMPMDPMAMQQMMMSGGFGAGMGMNMGMGMGMGSMGGFDAGNGFNNGWNGQQSWNNGQNNFNHPNAAGMGHGDFGPNNSGFYQQNAAGFNQGNYGQQNQYNNGFQQNNYGFRGRGRGRGFGYGHGRGGYGGHNNYQQTMPYQKTATDQGFAGGGADDAGSDATKANVDEFGREIRDESATQNEEPQGGLKVDSQDEAVAKDDDQPAIEAAPSAEFPDNHAQSTLPSGFSKTGFSAPADQTWGAPTQPAYGAVMQRPQSMTSAVPVLDVPINAPKGPKAMRDGLPNTSVQFLRNRGYGNITIKAPSTVNGESTPVAAQDEDQPVEVEAEKENQHDEEHARSRSRSDGSRSREVSRDRNDTHKNERRRHRHRSHSLDDDERDDDDTRDRRRHHASRYDDNRNDHHDDRGDADESDRPSRHESPAESRRSSHHPGNGRDKESRSERRRYRDYRDKMRDEERDKEREAGREHKSSSSKHRSSRHSHRDRSRSTHRHSRRDRHDDRSRSREHRRRRHRDSSEESRRHRHNDREKSHGTRDDQSEVVADTKLAQPDRAKTIDLPVEIPKGPRAMSKPTHNNVAPPTRPSTVMGIKGASLRQQSSSNGTANKPVSSLASRITTSDARDDRSHDRDRDRSSRHSRTESRRESTSDAPSAKKVDPHEMEREKRNRERLLKEAQRMAGLAGGMGRKRERDDVGSGSGRKKRRSELDGGLDDRVARGEDEREAARW